MRCAAPALHHRTRLPTNPGRPGRPFVQNAGVPLPDETRRAIERAAAATARPFGVVLDVGYTNGLAALRSLRGAGAPVLAVDHRAGALGLRSRNVIPVLAPDPANDEAGFVEILAEVAAVAGRDGVLFPTHDGPLLAAAAHAERLRPFHLHGSDYTVIEPLMRKRPQLEAARAAGVPVPDTWIPTSRAEAEALAATVTYPVILKPSHGVAFKAAEHVQVIEAHAPADLVAGYERIAAFGDEALVQDLVPGGDDALWTAGCLSTDGGRLRAVFCGRKLVQEPPGFGTCRIGEARFSADVVEQARRLLLATGFDGITQIEFKRDPRDGAFRLIEINLRTWQWHSLATRCGVDLVGLAYRHAIGESIPDVTVSSPRDDGRRWVATIPHLQAAFRRRESPVAALRAFGPRVEEPILSLRDPLPGARMAAGAVLAPLLRRRAARRRP